MLTCRHQLWTVAALLTLALSLLPSTANAQPFGGFAGNQFANFGGLGLPGGFNVLNGFGPFGNTRILPSQQPILNVFNGQTSLLQIQQFQWFPTNVQVVQAGGQVAFVPQYQPLPQANYWPIQAVYSPNSIVRMSTAPVRSGGGPGPLFPIHTFITPVFEGGAMGSSVPFTQFIGAPGFNTMTLNTTVGVPFGGNALLGRYGMQAWNRNAFGAPIFGNAPFFAPAFQNNMFGANMNFMPFMAPRLVFP
jgi:hypothetical protein